MKYAKLSYLADRFLKMAQDYSVQDIVKTLSNLKSFNARLQYCRTNFKRLGAGTSRIAFLLPDGKVLKLAKNAKGIAQNNVESDYYLSSNPVVNGTIASDPNDLWIIVNLATKINAGFFQGQIGLSFDDYCNILKYWAKENKRPEAPPYMEKPVNYEQVLDTNAFVQDITELMGNGDLMLGDFCRLSSYGNVGGKLMVTDYGASKSVYEEFYAG